MHALDGAGHGDAQRAEQPQQDELPLLLRRQPAHGGLRAQQGEAAEAARHIRVLAQLPLKLRVTLAR